MTTDDGFGRWGAAWLMLVTLLAGCSAGGARPGGDGINLRTRLADLVDVAGLARSPLGREELCSSHDVTGGNQDWADLSKSEPDGSFVVLEADGPGCVDRIWMTANTPAKWMVYIDGETTPRLQGVDPFAGGDERSPRSLFQQPLCGQASGGYYSYVPIPFRASIRIVAASGYMSALRRPYYQVNYSLFPKDVAVTSLPATLEDVDRQALTNAVARMKNREAELDATLAGCLPSDRLHIAPGGAATWFEWGGPGVVTALSARLVPADSDTQEQKDRRLRELAVEILWDGGHAPSVNVPFGDFFCNAFAARRYVSWLSGKVDDTYVCRFPMPFRDGAVCRLLNGGDTPVDVDVGARVAPRAGDGGTAPNYFHCTWHASAATTAPRGIPHRILDAAGPGYYVGTYLVAMGTDGGWSILEGDDKIARDGEATASWWGTGLEDYFNGAWYYKGLSDLPFSGLISKAAMQTEQYRLHIADRIRFTNGIVFDFEFGHAPGSRSEPNTALGYMSSAAFWYAPTPSAVPSLPDAAHRFPAANRVTDSLIMDRVFELEHAGLYREARERCLAFGERHRGTPAGEVIALRAAAYLGSLGDVPGMVAEIHRVQQAATSQVARAQASVLAAMAGTTNVYVLGAMASCPVQVYLDGQPVLEGATRNGLLSRAVRLSRGEHVLGVQVDRAGPEPWLLVGLSGAGGDAWGGSAWDVSAIRPQGWPQAARDGRVHWQPLPNPRISLPTLTDYLFVPNAFPDLQSGFRMVRPFTDAEAGRTATTVYLTRAFTLPGSASGDVQ